MTTNTEKAVTEKATEQPKVTVIVTAEDGCNFKGDAYKKGDKITCTEAQAAILKKQGVA